MLGASELHHEDSEIFSLKSNLGPSLGGVLSLSLPVIQGANPYLPLPPPPGPIVSLLVSFHYDLSLGEISQEL